MTWQKYDLVGLVWFRMVVWSLALWAVGFNGGLVPCYGLVELDAVATENIEGTADGQVNFTIAPLVDALKVL